MEKCVWETLDKTYGARDKLKNIIFQTLKLYLGVWIGGKAMTLKKEMIKCKEFQEGNNHIGLYFFCFLQHV